MTSLESVGKVKSIKRNIEGYEWVIENFSTIDAAKGSFITTPMLSTAHPEIKWRLALFPNGRTKSIGNDLSIYVQLFGNVGTGSHISAGVTCFVIDGTDDMRHEFFNDYSFELLPEMEYHNVLLPEADGEDSFIERSALEDEDLLVNGCLKIYCEIFFYDSAYSSLLSSYSNPDNDRIGEFDDFKKLLADDKFSDFTLVLGNKEIRVHKANRSPVFEAMLANEMQEKKENRVEITDIQYPVLKELLQFIYTGTVENIKNVSIDLLIAADKYCVPGLKMFCEKTFSNSLNVENALEHLALADTYNCAFLKSRVIQYIVHHSNEIIEKKEFATLRSDLMFEIIRSFSQRLTTSDA